jgi:magnesium-transporting ATPase (P-type)
LVIDLGIDIIPSLALSREPPENEKLQHISELRHKNLFDLSSFYQSLYLGAIIAILSLIGCVSVWMEGGWTMGDSMLNTDPYYIKGTTMMFVGIIIGQVGNLLSQRFQTKSLFQKPFYSNPTIWWSIIIQMSITCSIVYLSFLQSIFSTNALDFIDWLWLLLIPIIVVGCEECRKCYIRSNKKIKQIDKYN